jgi:hypothetical protein
MNYETNMDMYAPVHLTQSCGIHFTWLLLQASQVPVTFWTYLTVIQVEFNTWISNNRNSELCSAICNCLCLIIKHTKLILVCNGNFAVSYPSAVSSYSFSSVQSQLTHTSNLCLMVHLNFHYKMINLITFKTYVL